MSKSKVQRYKPDFDCFGATESMHGTDDGEYVLYADYARVEQERDALKDKGEWLVVYLMI